MGMQEQGLRLAILGATGEVGSCLLELLLEREFAFSELFLLASSRSAGSEIAVGDEIFAVQDAEQFDFSQVDLVLSSAGGSVSERMVPKAIAQGACVVDNTSHFRMEPGVPLVVPEVNGQLLEEAALPSVFPCANCSTIQLVMALHPLHDNFGLRSLQVATYQSVSGAGRSALDELSVQSQGMLSGSQVPPSDVFDKHIGFNVLPRIGAPLADGSTTEERKMVEETRKILQHSDLPVSVTCTRVPVFYGHSEAVWVELEEEVNRDELIQAMIAVDGLEVHDDLDRLIYPTPLEGAGTDAVYVGRIRPSYAQFDEPLEDAISNRWTFWVVSDNIRKGAALNSIQIAELLADRLTA